MEATVRLVRFVKPREQGALLRVHPELSVKADYLGGSVRVELYATGATAAAMNDVLARLMQEPLDDSGKIRIV